MFNLNIIEFKFSTNVTIVTSTKISFTDHKICQKWLSRGLSGIVCTYIILDGWQVAGFRQQVTLVADIYTYKTILSEAWCNIHKYCKNKIK